MAAGKERFWLRGHEWGLPGLSRITPAEAAFYLDVPNLIEVGRACALASHFSHIAGVMMDDFFSHDPNRVAVYTPADPRRRAGRSGNKSWRARSKHARRTDKLGMSRGDELSQNETAFFSHFVPGKTQEYDYDFHAARCLDRSGHGRFLC